MTNLNITLYTNSERVANLCIKEQYYTCGTVQDYSRLLEYADNRGKELDEVSLNWIAKDIMDHSAQKWETLSNIKFKLLNDACVVMYE